MKRHVLTFSGFLLFSCIPEQANPSLDVSKELASIETTRQTFTKGVKESDFKSIREVMTADALSIPPGGVDWEEMFSNSTKPGFPYDSIIMSPIETVIVSDSVAYDFGVSKVYYTNSRVRQWNCIIRS